MCDRMGISQSNLTFTFFGFFWGNSKEVTFPMALLHYVSFANCSGLGGLRRLASNEGGVSQTLGINLWCLPLVVSPKSGQFPFKDLKSKPELKKVSPSDLPHDPKKKKKTLDRSGLASHGPLPSTLHDACATHVWHIHLEPLPEIINFQPSETFNHLSCEKSCFLGKYLKTAKNMLTICIYRVACLRISCSKNGSVSLISNQCPIIFNSCHIWAWGSSLTLKIWNIW